MATKEKFNRKELREPDEVQEALGAVARYVQDNQRTVLFGAAGVFAAIIVAVIVTGQISKSKDAVAASFARAVANVEYDSPSAALVGLDNVSSAGSSGPYAAMATAYKAKIEADGGDLEKALADYTAAQASAPTDYLRQAAIVGRAFALAKLKRTDEALLAYDKAAAIDGPYRIEALESKARIAASASKRDVQIAALRSLLEIEDLSEAKRADAAAKLDTLTTK